MTFSYTADGQQRIVTVSHDGEAWVVVDELAGDNRVVERVVGALDSAEARAEADAIADDYAGAAGAAGEPLVCAAVGA